VGGFASELGNRRVRSVVTTPVNLKSREAVSQDLGLASFALPETLGTWLTPARLA